MDISEDVLNWSKVTGNTCIMLQIFMFQINYVIHLFFYSSLNPEINVSKYFIHKYLLVLSND